MAELYPYQKQLLIDLEGIAPGEMKIITSGRRAGKSYLNQLYGAIQQMRPYPVKISWEELPGNVLRAIPGEEGIQSLWGLREEDMDPIGQWSKECNCGTRTSFDMWKFNSRKHMTMFLMKWSS